MIFFHFFLRKIWKIKFWPRKKNLLLECLLRFSTMFYKTKLKLIEFVMMLDCFTELNIRNTQKRKHLCHTRTRIMNFFHLVTFHQLGPLGRVGLVVTESVCLCVCLMSVWEGGMRKKGAGKKEKKITQPIEEEKNLFKLVLVLLSASVERVSVSRMRDFYLTYPFFLWWQTKSSIFRNYWIKNAFSSIRSYSCWFVLLELEFFNLHETVNPRLFVGLL